MRKQICFPVKESLIQSVGFERWEILNRFGEEANYGEIYTACLNKDCKFVLKYMPYDKDNTEKGIIKEVTIQNKCADLNLSLPIIDAWLCEEGGAFVMKKLDYTVANLFNMYQTNTVRNLILANIIMILDKLHLHKLYHGDLHLNNIMVKQHKKIVEKNIDELELYNLSSYSYYFIDFGMSGKLNEKTMKYTYKDYSDIYDHLQELQDEDPSFDNTVEIMKIHMKKFD
jgi:tRNA A-37 threonylcarbamoyl transferase component Bud32